MDRLTHDKSLAAMDNSKLYLSSPQRKNIALICLTLQFKMGTPSCWQPELGLNEPEFSAGISWSSTGLAASMIIFRATTLLAGF